MVIKENKQALKKYVQVDIQSHIENVSPHHLIQMLIDGALSHIVSAKGYMHLGQVSEKGSEVSKVISIIGELRDSLDHQRGGLISDNLERLYVYMTQKLVEANTHNDIALLDEVYELLMTIKIGWSKIVDHPEKTGAQKR